MADNPVYFTPRTERVKYQPMTSRLGKNYYYFPILALLKLNVWYVNVNLKKIALIVNLF